ncbi:hypothetical protein DSO57_1022872 [Entomophthora muscae]|uniref:Uncharacterized protein n=1 Tax=Entomophthora muscae TaxID=34485 RepID=A0ACC2SFL2_9FUNG|nr:hypothetical protein DSO57_1022872 [Entomophthora muscae]
MATPHQETFLLILDGNIPKGYLVYQDQLVLTSVYNQLRLGQHDIRVTPLQTDLSHHMLNLQLESFTGDVEGANIVSWLHYTKTHLHIYQVPEPMWVATASELLTAPVIKKTKSVPKFFIT